MIFGKPSSLILSSFTAIFNVVVLVVKSQGTDLSFEVVSAINAAAASIIAVAAYSNVISARNGTLR